MPPDAPRASMRPISFALRLTAWSLALFGLFRLPWVGAHVFLPATQLQAAAGAALLGPSIAADRGHARLQRRRRAGAVPRGDRRVPGGLAHARGRRGRRHRRDSRAQHRSASARSDARRRRPMVPRASRLRLAGRAHDRDRGDRLRVDARGGWASSAERNGVAPDRAQTRTAGSPFPLVFSVRFALVAVGCLVLFTLASPLYLESARVLALAVLVARAAAFLLRGVGVDATAAAGVLATPRGAFLVTQECIATPLIPVYVAAVLVYARERWRPRGVLDRRGRCRCSSPSASRGCSSSPCRRAWTARRRSSFTRSRRLPWSRRHGVRRRALAVRREAHATYRPRRRGPAGRRRCSCSCLARPYTRAILRFSRRPRRRSAGRAAVSARVPVRPVPRALGRGVRPERLDAVSRAARRCSRRSRSPSAPACSCSSSTPASPRWSATSAPGRSSAPALIIAAVINVAPARR